MFSSSSKNQGSLAEFTLNSIVKTHTFKSVDTAFGQLSLAVEYDCFVSSNFPVSAPVTPPKLTRDQRSYSDPARPTLVRTASPIPTSSSRRRIMDIIERKHGKSALSPNTNVPRQPSHLSESMQIPVLSSGSSSSLSPRAMAFSDAIPTSCSPTELYGAFVGSFEARFPFLFGNVCAIL